MVSQVQRDALAGPIIDWVRNNPGDECRMRNGRRGLIAHVKNFYAANFSKKLTKLQVKRVITGLLNKHRPGIIRPEYTNKDRKMKAVGAPGRCSKEEQDKLNKKNNPINNPIWNPINNPSHNPINNPIWGAKRKQAANDAENRKNTEDQGLRHTMRSKHTTKLLCERLLSTKYAILGDLTMRQAIETNSFAIYIGTTKRTIKEEDLRWMTARGAQDQRASRSGRVVYTGSRRNRPVLVRLDGTCITMGEARRTFRAKSVVISHSRLWYNEISLEDALQTELQPNRLGLERLHRHPAMGAKLAASAPRLHSTSRLMCVALTSVHPTSGLHPLHPGWPPGMGMGPPAW
jgi:hypothetical protein